MPAQHEAETDPLGGLVEMLDGRAVEVVGEREGNPDGAGALPTQQLRAPVRHVPDLGRHCADVVAVLLAGAWLVTEHDPDQGAGDTGLASDVSLGGMTALRPSLWRWPLHRSHRS